MHCVLKRLHGSQQTTHIVMSVSMKSCILIKNKKGTTTLSAMHGPLHTKNSLYTLTAHRYKCAIIITVDRVY